MLDDDSLTRAVNAFRTEERRWQATPIRILGQPVTARRFNEPPEAGRISPPINTTFKDHVYLSTEQRTEAIFRACVEQSVEAAERKA